ncbi:hypothetical protein [Thermoleptolyngbya sp. M55_K2018_002]|uniref:hypothetical protein n=1 Tax=Thermoleptolyngbya sp. M55_K2018_002 TaxID=2747808 RepID=UPI0019E05E7C|nr:hypothetical protein [Thermoleptolyngbya sp. M55_K2018_002]HIK41163.1 hypothetical protein [Thermoleptolyngbya sp. M55_K2018_002]
MHPHLSAIALIWQQRQLWAIALHLLAPVPFGDRPLSPRTDTFGRSPSSGSTDIFGRSPSSGSTDIFGRSPP